MATMMITGKRSTSLERATAPATGQNRMRASLL